ncbi:MAG: hypothetical protein ABSD56_01620 [Bryobacteraceae bacterium]|jgi:hypothetical protein
MNFDWIAAAMAGAGFAANLLWTLHNHVVSKGMVEIENKVLAHIDEIKAWADEKFVEERVCLLREAEVARRLNIVGA